MKKAISIIFAAALTLALAACGGAQDTTPTQGATGQQQGQQQQTSGTQTPDANQGASGQADDQQAVTTPDTTAENRNVELFNEFLAEYARANPGRQQGVSNGVAYWTPSREGILLHDINTGQTTAINTTTLRANTRHIHDRLYNPMYWNGYVYALMAWNINTNASVILRFDLQGNLIDEHAVTGNITGFRIQEDKILILRDGIHEILSARDFSVIQSPLAITRYVGHGRTEEITSYRQLTPFLANDRVYIRYSGNTGHIWYVMDLLTSESQQVDYITISPIDFIYGKFAITFHGATVIETGEILENVSMVGFTGTNFHTIIQDWAGERVMRYNPFTMEREVVFAPPNPGSELRVLSDDYLIVQDYVGMFLYRFVDGDVNGEFVREIILP